MQPGHVVLQEERLQLGTGQNWAQGRARHRGQSCALENRGAGKGLPMMPWPEPSCLTAESPEDGYNSATIPLWGCCLEKRIQVSLHQLWEASLLHAFQSTNSGNRKSPTCWPVSALRTQQWTKQAQPLHCDSIGPGVQPQS